MNGYKHSSSPPRWAGHLLEWFCAPHLLEEIQGDLQERFYKQVSEAGERKARQHYIWNVLGFIRPFKLKHKLDSISKPLYTDMFRNYLKIALRTLQKHRVYSFINLTGLALACTFCLLVYTFIRHELSFDRFHEKSSRLYRVESIGMGKGVDLNTRSFLSSLITADEGRLTRLPPDLGPDLQTSLPEIKQSFRFLDSRKEIFGVHGEKFHQENICIVDSNFFDMFSFRLLKGNPQTALADPGSVVLSEQTARRYFGTKNPMGKTIEVIRDKENLIFTVTGIIEDAPSNSSIYYEALFPLHAQGLSDVQQVSKKNFHAMSTLVLVELTEKTQVQPFKAKLKKFAQEYYKDQLKERNIQVEKFGLGLTLLAETHLDSIPWGWPRMGKRLNLYVLSLISLLVLFIASLNYIFLALTQASSRLQEVGVRKVNGASRSQIVLQFWAETFVLAILSVCISFFLSIVLLPVFSQLMGSQMNVQALYSPPVWISAIILALFVSLLTGIYPAILLSRFNPVRLLQRNRTYRINPSFSRFMVVIQYALCLFLVVSTLVMKEQFRYMTNKDLGFDKENVVVIDLMENQSLNNGAYLLEKFKQMAVSEPGILAVSGGDNMTTASMLGFYTINGQELMVSRLSGDYGYVQMMGLDIIEGRNISARFPTDTARNGAIVINEQLAKLVGKECPVGNPCRFLDNATIVGIVKDFHYTNLSQPIGPAILHFDPEYIPSILIKTRPGNLPATLSKIEKAWKQYTNNKPLNLSFMDQAIAQMYESQQRWMHIIEIAAGFAIVVACLGLFGLSGLNAVNRTKEIGIRKVLGASVGQIFLLLNKSTIRLAIVSFIIAVPIAYYFIYHWLEDFAYRIELGWKTFAIAGCLGLLIVLIAVSYYSIKAALANPVKSLRNE